MCSGVNFDRKRSDTLGLGCPIIEAMARQPRPEPTPCEAHERLTHDRKIFFESWISWHPSNGQFYGPLSPAKLKKFTHEAKEKLDAQDEKIADHIRICDLCVGRRQP
jgi:hypothetical protein